MATYVTPATELDAVNAMLRSFGETTINTLSGTLPIDAAEARETLLEVVRAVQLTGWYWNTEYLTLTPDSNGKIALPLNTLQVDAVENDEGLPVTSRGGFLYNLTPFESGDIWTDRDGGIDLQFVFGLSYDDMPPSAQKYCYMRAARIFVARQEGDQIALNTASQDENFALADMRREENRAKPRTVRRNASMQRILARGIDTAYNTYGTRSTITKRYRGSY